MQRLDSIAEFNAFQERAAGDRRLEVPTIVISAGTCGQASGANDLVQTCVAQLVKQGLTDKIGIRVTGCHGFCQMEPSVLIEPRGTFYPRVGSADMIRLVDAVAQDTVLRDLLYVSPDSGRPLERQSEIPFFKKQLRSVLARNQQVDPIRIASYIEVGGYSSFVKALTIGSPQWVLDEVKSSRLRGRGGAGFPTALKWELLAREPNGRGKFLVCNADEGDPGAYMDRAVIEGNPHSVIEGMLIGAYATGADAGIVYVRNEYPLAIKHLIVALRQVREQGLLGENILGTGFSFDIELVKGAGAFVCGEETALMQSVEGRIGEPRQRPPFPVERGIAGKPTAINNVETWANIPIIIADGASAFVKIGSEHSTGTKIFSLVGKIRNTGLVEVPMGVTIREIVYDIGGGPVDGSRIKTVQTGGPSGDCIPVEMFDLPVDFEGLSQAGCIMGSGGMIVMDETTCMVDVAKYFMEFMKDESCGKCFICRKGTQRMHEILDDISQGRASLDQLGLLEELATVVKDTSLCGLGQLAPNTVLGTLRHFRHEYLSHIEARKCPARVCRQLNVYKIDPDICVQRGRGCGVCRRECPEKAIFGQRRHSHRIDAALCRKCGICLDVCKFDAVLVE